jgi:hypothetical protein
VQVSVQAYSGRNKGGGAGSFAIVCVLLQLFHIVIRLCWLSILVEHITLVTDAGTLRDAWEISDCYRRGRRIRISYFYYVDSP